MQRTGVSFVTSCCATRYRSRVLFGCFIFLRVTLDLVGKLWRVLTRSRSCLPGCALRLMYGVGGPGRGGRGSGIGYGAVASPPYGRGGMGLSTAPRSLQAGPGATTGGLQVITGSNAAARTALAALPQSAREIQRIAESRSRDDSGRESPWQLWQGIHVL